MDSFDFGGAPTVMIVFIALFMCFFVFIVGLIIWTAVRRYRAAKDAGLDPWAGDIQLMAQAKDSKMLESSSPADRLAEVEELRTKGLISNEEYRQLRAKALGLSSPDGT